MNKCKFIKNCDDYKANSKKCNHKAGKHCKIHRMKSKTMKKIKEEVLVLNRAIESDAVELASESRNRINELLEDDKQVRITNLIDALCGRFEEKLNKQQERDMNL